jgi:hypothetical protein
MFDGHVALGQDLFKVAVRDGIADVEKNGMQDYCLRVVYALEINHRSDLPVCFARAPSIASVLNWFKPRKVCDTARIRGAAWEMMPDGAE